MRPFQIILLSTFAVLAIAGLIFFANFKGFGKNADQIGTVTIWGTVPASAMTTTLADLARIHKEYTRVSYVERQAETFDSELANAIASGTGPDLILVSQEHLVTESSRTIVIPSSSISERTFRDRYLPVFELYLTSGGTYGIPALVDPLVLYYNRSILATVGVATPPATWEAVTGLAPAVTRVNAAQTIERSTIALGTYGNVGNARAILSTLFLQAGQGITSRAASGVRSTLTSNPSQQFGISSTQSALSYYTEFANPAKTTYSWNRSMPAARQAFGQGDLALYLGFASERAAIAAASPNLDFDMAVAPQPGTASARVVYGKAYAFLVPKASRNAQGALQVAFALTAPDLQPTLARTTGMAPGARSQLTPDAKDLYQPIFYPEALIAKGWLSPTPTATDGVFAAMIENVTSGRMSAAEALSSAHTALNAVLGQ